MAWSRSRIFLSAAWAAVAFAISVAALRPQQNTDKSAALRVPHTTSPVLLDCSNDSSASWDRVPRVTLSSESGTLGQLINPNEAVAVTRAPSTIGSKLDSFQAQYAFQWDENRVYGYVVIKEEDVDSRHPQISEKTFKHFPFAAAFEDLFYSTAVVEIGAPSWHRWITEMHVHVRAPNAKPMTSMFFGRTNDEEDFHVLSGEGITCPSEGGWIAKFAAAWLPFGEWQPKSGTAADVRLIAPLAHSHGGYMLARVVPFVLTN